MPILIKNGLVYDGTGTAPVKRDILVERKRIVKIGETLKAVRVSEVIDATGAFVVPGFVDVHSHSDHNLSIFSDPEQEECVREGITTIVGGNCGKSLVPFAPRILKTLSDWEAGFSSLSVDWVTARDFFASLYKKGLGVNFGTLIGLGTLRAFTNRGSLQDFTDAELQFAKKILEDSFRAGALGFSSGFEYADECGVSAREVDEYMRIVKQFDGVYAVHLKNSESGMPHALRETVSLAKKYGVRAEISHFIPDEEHLSEYAEGLAYIEEEGSALEIHFDVSPLGTRAFSVSAFLPKWVKEEGYDALMRHISSPHMRERILSHMKTLPFHKIRIIRATSPSGFLVGKKISDFAESLRVDGARAILKLMEISAGTALCAFENVSLDAYLPFVRSPYSIVASHSAGTGLRENISGSERGVFSKFLSRAYEETAVPFEKIIMKCTSIPARKYKIGKRGMLREGYYADIAVLRDFVPSDVFVNGSCVLHEGKPTHARSGHILKKKENTLL